MPKPLAVVFADSHLQDRTWKMRAILGDAYFSFEQIVSYTIERGIRYLIGAGDLINRRVNEPGPILFLKEQLDRLQQAGVTLLYVQGQHEMDEQPWLGLGDKSAVHLHHKTLDLGGLGVRGLDFQPADKLKAELDAIAEDVDVLVAHQVWLDFMGDLTLPQGEFADVSQVKLLVTGDYHKSIYDVKKHRRKDGGLLKVYSPGATHQLKIDEPSECSFGLLLDDCTIKRVPLLTRKCDDFSIMTEDQLNHFLSAVEAFLEGASDYATDKGLPPELHLPLWRFTYSHRLSDLPARIGKIVGGRANLFWKEQPPTEDEKQELSPEIRATVLKDKDQLVTLASCLPLAVNKDEEPEVFGVCQRLLDAENPEVELAKWKKEILDE